MASLAVGEASTGTNPVLNLYTHVGNPPLLTDVASLEFRIFDISTPAKKGTPVQVYPATAGTYETLDPTTDFGVGGHRVSTGRYYAPYTVPLSSAIGDHRIEWRFQLSALAPFETLSEEFFVMQAATLAAQPTYCSVSDIRAEGFTDPVKYPEARILMLIEMASRWIDKWTQRWFYPQEFTESNPMILEGAFSRTIHLEIPIIEVTKLSIENQGTVNASLSDIDAGEYRVYNRHISQGLLRPDDRENPKISFIQNRIPEIVKTGLFPSPLVFGRGRLNVFLEGKFGYTDPDGSPCGKTPEAIRFATCLLVIRELRLESEACEKLNDLNRWRITSDKEGSTTVKLQDYWLRGAFTGDPRIDNIIMMYKTPARIGVA